VHEALHIAVLACTILGAASLALLVLWPALFTSSMPRSTRALAVAAVAVAGVLLLLEWRVVH